MEKSDVQKLIEEFLAHLTVQVDTLEVIDDKIHPIFLINTPDSGVLIGNNGENLRALNYLIKRMVERRSRDEETTPFLLDVNGYHSRKIQEVKDQASILAERARMFKSDVEMSPMNAYERMIVHSTFADDPEIQTESAGLGKTRHVVFKYKTKEVSQAETTDSALLSVSKTE